MQPNSENLETVLRSAPSPRPPADLKARLLRAARAEAVAGGGTRHEAGGRATLLSGMGAGWRRWLLLLVPTGVAAALGTFAVVQHDQIREMKAELQGLAAEQRLTVPATDGSAMDSRRTALELPDERSEIARLRELLSLLEADAVTVARLEAENVKLKVDIAAAWASMPPEIQEMVQARDRATAIQCVNNLKQLQLGWYMYCLLYTSPSPRD